MDSVLKEKIRLYKKNNEGINDYYKLVKLEEEYDELDELLATTWIVFTIMSMFTLFIGLPILLPLAILFTIYNGKRMKKKEEEIRGLL